MKENKNIAVSYEIVDLTKANVTSSMATASRSHGH